MSARAQGKASFQFDRIPSSAPKALLIKKIIQLVFHTLLLGRTVNRGYESDLEVASSRGGGFRGYSAADWA
jgi:hypothetical protein